MLGSRPTWLASFGGGRQPQRDSPSPFWPAAGSGQLRASGHSRSHSPADLSRRRQPGRAGLRPRQRRQRREVLPGDHRGRAASSSTSTTTAGSTCFSWTAARSPIPRWPDAHATACIETGSNGTFEDVTAASNIRHRGYGMGACAGDVDNDGLTDLYITNVGPNSLYRNTGGGRFAEVPKAGGADSGAVEHELRLRRHRSRRRPRSLRHQLR